MALRGLKPGLDFSLQWTEVAWLGLQTEVSLILGIHSLNLVWEVRSPHDVERHHPGMRSFRQPAGYTGVLYRGPEVPEDYRTTGVQTL